jgi:hypothetical protein
LPEQNKRVSLSFRKKKDSELLKLLEQVDEGDLSKFLRGLIYDGLEYRKAYGSSQPGQPFIKPPAVAAGAESAPVPVQKDKTPKEVVEKSSMEQALDDALDF